MPYFQIHTFPQLQTHSFDLHFHIVNSYPLLSSFHFVSFRFISFRSVSFRFISFRFISFRSVSFRFISFRFISFHFVSFRFISFHFISFDLISFHFISWRVILERVLIFKGPNFYFRSCYRGIVYSTGADTLFITVLAMVSSEVVVLNSPSLNSCIEVVVLNSPSLNLCIEASDYVGPH